MLITAVRLPSKHLLRAGFWIKAPLWLGLLETIHASHRILDNLHEYCIVWEQEQSGIGQYLARNHRKGENTLTFTEAYSQQQTHTLTL